MKRLLAAIFLVCFAVAPAAAEVSSKQVMQAKTLNASATTDGTPIDLGAYKFISYQFRCNSASTTININVDWIAGSASGTTYLAVPLLANGSAMTQLRTNYTTESTTTWSTLQSIQPPVSPVGTLRFTNNASTADVVCDAIVNVGN